MSWSPELTLRFDGPFVLVEVGAGDQPDPVLTKSPDVTNVCIDWRRDYEPEFVEAAIAVLREHEDDHPRIALALRRLEAIQSLHARMLEEER